LFRFLTLSKKSPLLKRWVGTFFVSAGVHTPAEMPRSSNKVMSKERSGLRISDLIYFLVVFNSIFQYFKKIDNFIKKSLHLE
jgi:hypothetical protein